LTDLILNDQKFLVEELEQEGETQTVSINGKRVSVNILRELGRDPFELLVRTEAKILRIIVDDRDENDNFPVMVNGIQLRASFGPLEGTRSVPRQKEAEGPIVITAPMSGRIVSLKVGAGNKAEEGQSLVILEAMKMENEIVCPRKGVIKEVYVQAGSLVKAGDKLALVD